MLELGIHVGVEYTEEEFAHVRMESEYGKLYGRSLEYSLMRPRSVHEMEQYLYRKTRPTRMKNGELKPGYAKETTIRVLDRLLAKSYVDDVRFATYWVENRRLKKGASARLLKSELQSKGVSSAIIEAALSESERDEKAELRKMIERKSARYSDKQKFIQYLVRQGFSYGDVTDELSGWGV